MCGIICYKGVKDGIKISFKALKNLEYRGYDSWGLAYKEENKIQIKKQIGKVPEYLPQELKEKNVNFCLGHTRWATTGKVTELNAHPHLSNNKKFAVVHNGIIENYQELKRFLKEKGFNFNSDTDTEVIPNLIEYFSRNKDFKEAAKESFRSLGGSNAFVAINQDSDMIVGAKNGSPLVLGIGDNEYFLASDIPAFL